MAGEDDQMIAPLTTYFRGRKTKRTVDRGGRGLHIPGIRPATHTSSAAPTSSTTTATHTSHTLSTSASTSLSAPLSTSTQTPRPDPPSAPLPTPSDTPFSWPPYPPTYDPAAFPYYPPPYPPHPYHTTYAPLSQSSAQPPPLFPPVPPSYPRPMEPVPQFQATTTVGPSGPTSTAPPVHPEPAAPAPAAPAPVHAGRMTIVPEGDTFNPSTQATHQIRDIIKSKLDGPYLSWKKIPEPVRQMWFREFERYFTWLPEHQHKVRQNFERRGAARYRDMLGTARKAGQRPAWIGESIWAELNRQWATPEYRQLSEKAKQNRGSDVGGLGASLHTGGSIPHTEHRRRLKQALGRDPTMAELHARTHQRQNNQGWVDRRSEQTQEEYRRVVELRRSTTEAGEASGSGTHTDPSDFSAWEEAAGGRKKARVYGIGSVAQASPSSYSSCSVDSVNTPSEATVITQRLDVLASSFQAYMQRSDANFELQRSQIDLLLGHIRQQGEASGAPAPPVTEPVEDDATESDQ